MKVINVKFVVSQARAPFEGFNAHFAKENVSVGTKHFDTLTDALNFGEDGFRRAAFDSLHSNYSEGETRTTKEEIETALAWLNARDEEPDEDSVKEDLRKVLETLETFVTRIYGVPNIFGDKISTDQELSDAETLTHAVRMTHFSEKREHDV